MFRVGPSCDGHSGTADDSPARRVGSGCVGLGLVGARAVLQYDIRSILYIQHFLATTHLSLLYSQPAGTAASRFAEVRESRTLNEPSIMCRSVFVPLSIL